MPRSVSCSFGRTGSLGVTGGEFVVELDRFQIGAATVVWPHDDSLASAVPGETRAEEKKQVEAGFG